jgi:hypothetical protein
VIDVVGKGAITLPWIERACFGEPLEILLPLSFGPGVLVRLNDAHPGCIVLRDRIVFKSA